MAGELGKPKSDASVEHRKDGVVVYTIRESDDGIELTLSMTHRRFILFLVEHGGEAPYDYRKVKPDTRQHIKLLVTMGVLSEVKLIGRHDDDVLLRLTDLGRNLVPLLQGKVL